MADETPSLAKLLSRRRLLLASGGGDKLLLADGTSYLLLENGTVGITTKRNGTGYAGQTGGAAKT